MLVKIGKTGEKPAQVRGAFVRFAIAHDRISFRAAFLLLMMNSVRTSSFSSIWCSGTSSTRHR